MIFAARANTTTMSFSMPPLSPRAPLSVPPCPGSSTTKFSVGFAGGCGVVGGDACAGAGVVVAPGIAGTGDCCAGGEASAAPCAAGADSQTSEAPATIDIIAKSRNSLTAGSEYQQWSELYAERVASGPDLHLGSSIRARTLTFVPSITPSSGAGAARIGVRDRLFPMVSDAQMFMSLRH